MALDTWQSAKCNLLQATINSNNGRCSLLATNQAKTVGPTVSTSSQQRYIFIPSEESTRHAAATSNQQPVSGDDAPPRSKRHRANVQQSAPTCQVHSQPQMICCSRSKTNKDQELIKPCWQQSSTS